MGAEGHIFEMITRFHQNREMLKSRRERVRKIRENYLSSYNLATSKTPTPANLKIIKENIRRDLQRRRRRALWITGGIIIVLIAGLLYWILNNYPLQTFADTFL